MKKSENTPLNIIEKINSRNSLVWSLVVLGIVVLFFSILDYQMIKGPERREQKAREEALKEKSSPKAPEAEVTTASVIAVGDNLYHESLIAAGQNGTDVWNYDKIYEKMKPEIEAADLAIIDQETVFTNDRDSLSAYPLFSTPVEVGDAVVNAGFDVVYSATNHIDDFGMPFLQETFDFWKTKHPEITLIGIHETQEDAEAVKVREVNGIRIAFLDYTYGTNLGQPEADGTYTPNTDGKKYVVDVFSQGTDRVAEMIRRAKEAADCVIFVAHWGAEEEAMPTEYEKQWASFLLKQGVDVVIGGHPHILQPYGRMRDTDGHEMVIFYSLGNFISNQLELPLLLGGMASFTIEKTELDGETSIKILDPIIKPTVMHCDEANGDFAPYLLEDYTRELAAAHSIHNYGAGSIFSVTNLYRKFEEIMSINVAPSAEENLLNYRFDYNGDLVDENGNTVKDTFSTTELEYYGELGLAVSDYDTFTAFDYTSGYTDRQTPAAEEG